MTYETALEAVHGLNRFGSMLGLDRLRVLLDRLGNPQKKLRFIHVAGTNGKGSVCTMLSAILAKAGYKTGLYISPYITDFRERIQINNTMIEKQAFTGAVSHIYPYVLEMEQEGLIITEFEFVCAVAFFCFAQSHCDVVVLETGLGGRFDATNTIDTPLCSVITNISYDHTEFLGGTLKEIAFEKSGIIKPGGITVIARQEPEAEAELVKNAEERNNTLVFSYNAPVALRSTAITENSVEYQGEIIKLNLPGNYQLDNVKAVVTVVDVLKQYHNFTVPFQAVRYGLAHVVHPARMEVLCEKPLIILDGAHNPSGMEALAGVIQTALGAEEKICIIGILKDKDISRSLEKIQGLFTKVIAVPVNNPRGIPPEELAGICKQYFTDVTVSKTVFSAFDAAFAEAEKQKKTIVVCGSLYLAGEIRPYILETVKKI